MKKLGIFGGSFFKKNCWHLEFLMNQIFGQRLSYLKNWGIDVNYCWNCGPTKLLLYFIEYRLDQLNNKHTIIAVNSATHFKGRSQKKCLLADVLKFFGPFTTKWLPCKIIAKLNGNHLLRANVFKLHEYQIFGSIKLHNMNKIWFASGKFNLLRWNKKQFSWFFKGFQLPEMVSDLRLCL